jgi:hypothetical protein
MVLPLFLFLFLEMNVSQMWLLFLPGVVNKVKAWHRAQTTYKLSYK